MQNTLDIYNSYDKNITKMIYMQGYEDNNYMVLGLTGPFSCAKAVSEFFGYAYY